LHFTIVKNDGKARVKGRQIGSWIIEKEISTGLTEYSILERED